MANNYKSITDFLKAYSGKAHNKGDDPSFGQLAYKNAKRLGSSIESRLTDFIMVHCSKWQNSGKMANYFWLEFRRIKHKNEPFSIAIYFFKNSIKVYVEVNNDSLDKYNAKKKEEYLRNFNTSIFKLPQPSCDHFYEGAIWSGGYFRAKYNYEVIPSDENNLIKAVQSQKYTKITTNIPIDIPNEYDDKQIEDLLLKAIRILIPYYDVLWDEQIIPSIDENEKTAIIHLTEPEIESALNEESETAGYAEKFGLIKTRQLNQKIISDLKRYYKGQCQLCGSNIGSEFGKEIVEAHHIEYFSKTQNNNKSNIVILCPNCHSLIHACDPNYDAKLYSFIFNNGKKMQLRIPGHLKQQ